MANKMLVDASHPEETRVVVVRGNRIEEFDFESEHKKQIKGNIYLAKVTRVEPSLQAAFVDYGGNRHGFLAFSEIHPDYYQIPVADRQALVEDELARAREEDENEERKIARARRKPAAKPAGSDDGDSVSESVEDAGADDARHGEDEFADGEELSENEHEAPELMGDENDGEGEGEPSGEDGGEPVSEDGESPSGRRRGRRSRSRRGNAEEAPGSDEEAEEVDELGAEDAMEEVPVRQPRAPRKQYKIQEVIKRRQILLVQVVKEERGNKGAALTTYLSLAGRYSVLMPNTARGGGISRKITNVADRKRLKEVARDLDVPRGMGIILRTAGAMRTKAEVKRDYEYLMRLWETVRGLTLSSSAPTLVYEEGSLIKRSIRDLYNKDIDQILVSGEDGYREAKDFMRMLMPSQSKVVQPYRDLTPIFARGGIEAQLDKMLQPHVTLKSGGYIIINQTEALVAIDVNSGRSTREHSIEDTAFQTNMEAAEEVARQLRLRDLAGLIVIDFIDMEEKRNNRAVEKKIKDCLKDDRARIQVGRISHFGLMEMSRQRIRASVLESTTQTCPVCNGVGHIRSSSSLALNVVRTIEEHLQKDGTHDLVVKVPTATALYVLNEKRGTIHELEIQFGLHIAIEADDTHGHQSVVIEHGTEATRPTPRREVVNPLTVIADELDDEIDAAAAAAAAAALEGEIDAASEANVEEAAVAGQPGESSDEERRRKRRRRRRRGGSDEQQAADGAEAEDGEADEVEAVDAAETGDDDAELAAEGDDLAGGEDISAEEEAARARKRRRRGRRGGRKNREASGEGIEGEDGESDDAVSSEGEAIDVVTEAEIEAATSHGFEPAQDVSAHEEYRPAANDDTQPQAEVADDPEPAGGSSEDRDAFEQTSEAPVADEPSAADDFASVSEPEADVPTEPVEPAAPVPAKVTSSRPSEDDDKPKRTGWWARRSFF